MGTQGEPAIIRKRAATLFRTKALMKWVFGFIFACWVVCNSCVYPCLFFYRRLSKENVKQLGRHLGKLSHSNPGVLFDFVSHFYPYIFAVVSNFIMLSF